MKKWAARLSAEYAEGLISLRHNNDIQIADCDKELWINGPEMNPAVLRTLKKIPQINIYSRDGDSLTAYGKRVPEKQLKNYQWEKINTFFSFHFPDSMYPAKLRNSLNVSLIASDQSTEAVAIVLDGKHYIEELLSISQVRLNALKFAVSEDAQLLFTGTPLPSLPGIYYYRIGPVLVPIAHRLMPALDPESLKSLFELRENELILFALDGSYQRLAEESFVPASRAAIRLSLDQGEVNELH
ncbi:MAG: hypothetical protein HRT89_03930 [Lentisphaeria bacterium]|nr:hypothetical protein [Lentisphaeria bacterium]NQZ67199.1 hypothetical protein [Lentisphaeria bacterium]